MDYAAHYNKLISRAKTRVITGYVERHHIHPRCMGGTDEQENIVSLTAEEHYVAHQILVKMYPHVRGLATAAVRMSKQCTGNKAYGWLRRKHAEDVSARQKGHKYNLGRTRPQEEKDRISATMKGRKKSDETRAKMSIAQRGNKKTLGLKRGKQSEEHKKKLSDAMRGRKITEEHKRKISNALKGITKSVEVRAKMSAAQKARRSNGKNFE